MSSPKRSKAEKASLEQGGGDRRRKRPLSRQGQEEGDRKTYRKLRQA